MLRLHLFYFKAPVQRKMFILLKRSTMEMISCGVAIVVHTMLSLKVHRRRTQEEEVLLEVGYIDSEVDLSKDLPQNVLCERSQIVYMERCGSQEFRCLNEMCISADFMCDGVDDCLDNSDELGCGKLNISHSISNYGSI